jgi:hypothetical protein
MALIIKKECILHYSIKNIWDIIVNNNDYKWRNDIRKIKILQEIGLENLLK